MSPICGHNYSYDADCLVAFGNHLIGAEYLPIL